jgi:CheY-like chemotaxis protein/HPt (histidine-containing phosphotransfer) domain-containing protein
MKNDFLTGKRILIAEDDFVNQKLISHSIQSTGAIFDIAGNGNEVIEFLKLGTYDLILMDINMPEMDGVEATKYIRNTMKIKTPIISMTGWSNKEDIHKFEKAGMNGTLSKPFGLDILYKTLHDKLILINHSEIKEETVENEEIKEEEEEEIIDQTPPTVDLSLLNELSESDSEYKKTIIHMFLDSMPETIRQIEDAYNVKNYEALAKAAHYAKSSLSVINVEDLRALVARLEMNCKKMENLHELKGLVKTLIVKYELVVQILNEEIK